MKIKLFALLFLMLSISSTLRSQELFNPSDTLNKKRLNSFIIGSSVVYTAALIGLSQAWYSEFEREAFHFFNDNGQWKQVDKVGHYYSTYQIALFSTSALQWTGVSEKKAYLWGSLTGILFMMPIEILDGFSSEYGASWGDILANVAGSASLYGQYLLWKEVRIHPKFSFHRTDYAMERPDVLGKNLAENMLKDYNGQTYWWSVDIYKFLNKDSKFPKWLNIAFGYGAEEMVYATDAANAANGWDSYRQYYLGLDVDLTHIKTRHAIWRILLYAANMIKIPAPTLEFNRKDGVRFHILYF